MATIISSKTTGGGGASITGDTSGILQLASADGTTAVTIDASQNVGIGTASPDTVSGYKVLAINGTTGGLIYFKYNGTNVAQISGDNTGATLYTLGGQSLLFGTNNAERMRIDSSGNVGIGGAVDSGAKTKISGATGTNQVLYVANNTGSGNQGGIRTFLSSTANNTNSYHFNGLTDTINNWYLYGNGTSSWSSDARLKKNIETTRDGYIDDVMKLRVVKYNWRNSEEGTPRELGLIAQEVENVFPGLVQDDFNPLSADDPILYKQLKGSVLPMILLKAIQEQQALITTLQTQITALNAKVGI